MANPDGKKRFIQEARAASALNHPNIITVYDIDSAGGTDFIAMEYVDGTSLDQVIGPRGIPLPEALRYAIEIADALGRPSTARYHSLSMGVGGLRPGVPEKLCDDCRWTWQWSSEGTRILFAAGSAGRISQSPM